MTDLEKLQTNFDGFGVAYDVLHKENHISLVLVANHHFKVKGYKFFYTTFEFELDGSFKVVGIFED